MVRRTRKIKRTKNKKGGQSKFWAKATEGAGDIKTGWFAAVAKGKEVGTGMGKGMKDFNEARQARLAEGGDGGRYSPLFQKMMESKVAAKKISDQVAFQRAARDKGASTDYSNPNPLMSPMKKRKRIGGLFGKKPQALPKQRRKPILPGQDPFAKKNPRSSKPKKATDAFGDVSLDMAKFMAHAKGGKRKTKKRRKKKKRKTKKRRRGGKGRKWPFKSQAEKDHEKSEKYREAAKRKDEQRRREKQPIQWDRNPLLPERPPEVPKMPTFIPGVGAIKNKPTLSHSKGSRNLKLVGGKKRRRKRKTKKRRRR